MGCDHLGLSRLLIFPLAKRDIYLRPPAKFCASPWTEGVLRMTGLLVPCCRSSFNYGNWHEMGIQNAWRSNQASLFRSKIVSGKFPTSDCESCYNKGTAANLRKMLGMPLQRLATTLKNYNSFGIGRIGKIRDLFDKKELDSEASGILANYFEVLDTHLSVATDETHRKSVEKLKVIGNIISSFLLGELQPKEVCSVRQINAVAICNARCIHCPFLYTGEVIRGVPMSSGANKKRMTFSEIEEAFSEESSVIDFFMNGSEFFLVENWKLVAARLKNECVQLRISTNGMLLTAENIKLLVDNSYISKLNISLDGATKITVEKIRKKVKFDLVCQHARFAFE